MPDWLDMFIGLITSKKRQFISLGIGLLAIFLGVLYENKIEWLLILAVVCFFIAYLIEKNEKYSKRTKFYFKSKKFSKEAENIFIKAKNEGGHIFSTHVRPKTDSVDKDHAVKHLSQTDNTVFFDRLIFLEDREEEKKFIKGTLKGFDKNVTSKVHYIKDTLILPLITWRVIPRVNFILYNLGNEYISLLGFGKLITADEDNNENKEKSKKTDEDELNFGIKTCDKRVFDLLKSYFINLTSNENHVGTISEIGKIKDDDDLFLPPKVQAILSKLQIFGDNCSDILHIGIFGKLAIRLNGLQKVGNWEDHDSDIDIMVIVKGGSVKITEEEINKKFNNKNTNVVWGHDEDYFYFYRTEDKITLDFQIKPKGNKYYEDNSLLGTSIFANYYTLYSSDEPFLHNLIELPHGISEQKRFELLVTDKKGLNEFKLKYKEHSTSVDPRRIISLTLKNLYWGFTGTRPPYEEISKEFLKDRWGEIFPKTDYKRTMAILEMKKEKLDKETNLYEFVNNLLDDAINYSNSKNAQ
ncbi:hypothetical protein GOV14_06655 [Candidatus Pacearchaeota archaeon]|nr:hypothetical protein [Candidatus Pacearchaeota archaeon]